MNQRTTKPSLILVRPAKTQISLRIRAVWSESSLIACAFYSLQAILTKTCNTRWMYWLILVFGGHTGIIVGFVVCSLKCVIGAGYTWQLFGLLVQRRQLLWLPVGFSCTPRSFWNVLFSKRKQFVPLGSKFFPVRIALLPEGRLGSKIFPFRVEPFLGGD